MGKTYTAKLSEDILGNITRINNVLERIPQKLKEYREDLAQLKKEFESAGQEAVRPFPQEKELAECRLLSAEEGKNHPPRRQEKEVSL